MVDLIFFLSGVSENESRVDAYSKVKEQEKSLIYLIIDKQCL